MRDTGDLGGAFSSAGATWTEDGSPNRSDSSVSVADAPWHCAHGGIAGGRVPEFYAGIGKVMRPRLPLSCIPPVVMQKASQRAYSTEVADNADGAEIHQAA